MDNTTEIKQKKYYDNIAKVYDSYYAGNFPLRLRFDVYDTLLKNENHSNKLSVLDAMCGGGQNTIYFKAKGFVVEGCDISKEQCRIYSLRHPDCKVKCCSILNTGYDDASFDIIITDSLHHIYPNTNRCLDEFYRILKPEGFLILWEPNSYSIIDKLRIAWQKRDKKYFQDNEKSLDIFNISKYYHKRMWLKNFFHGGNIGYVFVFGSMVLRIPHRLLGIYALHLLKLEKIINLYQPRFLSLYFAALFLKK